LKAIIVKELETKSVVWLQSSNQYLILEPITATIIQEILEGREIKQMASDLENKLDIPFEKVIDFVLDLEEKIIKPNTEINLKPPLIRNNYSAPKRFGYIKYYSINYKTFQVNFSNTFEVSLIHPKFAHLEVRSVSKPDHNFLIFNNENYTYLVMNGEFIGSWSKKEIHYFQGKFSMKIIEKIYTKPEENWLGVFHASAVGNKENSVLILGDSGNGKSTSLALLQVHGFHCIADDFVPVDNQKNVYSFPAGISIKKNSLETLLSHYPELENSAEFHYKRLNKIVRYLPPSDIEYQKKYPCKAFIFIKYDSNTDFEFKEIDRIEAFQNLIPDSWISQKLENVAVFLDWFSSLPCFELSYANNQKMTEKIGQLLKDEL